MNEKFTRMEVVAGFGEAVVENTEKRAGESLGGAFSNWVLGLGTLTVFVVAGNFEYFVR